MLPVPLQIAVSINVAPSCIRKQCIGNGSIVVIKLGFALIKPGIRRDWNIACLRAVHIDVGDNMPAVDRIGQRHAHVNIL